MARGQKPGAPFDATKKAAFVKAIRQDGVGRLSAASRVGISPKTFSNHMKSDPEFAAEVSAAEMDRDGTMVDDARRGLWMAAKKGNVTACQVILYNLAPEQWADRRAVNIKMSRDEALAETARLAGVTIDELQAKVA